MCLVVAMLAANAFHRRRRQLAGFTLVEVLVTFIILSIGLLGIVRLQTLSKVSQHQAVQRHRAVAVADSLLERIRINPAGLSTFAAGGSPLGGASIATEPNPDCSAAACDPTELAAHDLWSFEQALDGASVTVVEAGAATPIAGLINPRGCVSFTAATGKLRTGMLSVLVQWDGLQETSDAVQAGEAVCGGATAGADKFRRQVVASSFVIDEAEL
jgi:type IV pilus assembly protein PilV